jgi:hypothetical protein
MENSSFFAENMFSLFFPQKYVGTQSFGSRSIFCPLTSKISFFSPKILKIRLFFSFFVEPESRNQSGNVLIIIDGIEMKKKSSKY